MICSLKFATFTHYGQIEVVKWSLGDLLCCIAGISQGIIFCLAQGEFAYNNSFNRSTRLLPFREFHGISPQVPVDLKILPHTVPVLPSAEDFVTSVVALQLKIKYV